MESNRIRSPSDRAEEDDPSRFMIRDTGGRFVSMGPITPIRRIRPVSQKLYVSKLKEARVEIYEKFLASFVLKGTSKDSLPASRSKGILCDLFECLVQEVYRLGPNLRYASLRNFVVNGMYLQWGYAQLRNIGQHPKSYPGCRVPNTSLLSEMRAVTEWLQYLHNSNALVQGSVEEASDTAVQLLGGYRGLEHRVSEQAASASQPALGSGIGSNNGGAVAREVMFSRCGSSAIGNDTGRESNANIDVNRSGQDTEGAGASSREPVGTSLEQDGDLDVGNNFIRARELIESAKDHDCYVMVHLVLVKGAEWEFGLFSGMILREWERQGLTPTELMNAVLKFAHWKNNRIIDEAEHLERQRRLEVTARLMDKTRIAIASAAGTDEERNRLRSELRLFHNMSWDFMVRGKEDVEDTGDMNRFLSFMSLRLISIWFVSL